MIILYYIKGINRTDTPTYDSSTSGGLTPLVRQNAFFETHKVATIENSFYPPRYRDRIAISSDDVDFNTSFNYLSIYFNDKYYYYFVDNIEYVNEELMNVDITMDVIQTYIFNINIINGIVGRKSINRWDGDSINRDYLRENFSQGEFLFSAIDVDYTTRTKSGYIIASVVDLDTGTSPTNRHFAPHLLISTTKGETKQITGSMIYYFVPRPTDNSFVGVMSTTGTQYSYETQDSCFAQITNNPNYIYKAWFVDDITKCLANITPTARQSGYVQIVLSGTDYFYEMELGTDVNRGLVYRIGTATNTAPLTTSSKNIGSYYKNTFAGIPFSYTLCPQLVDSNYYKICYGESTSYCTYPIEKLSTNTISLHNTNDILYGNRVYWITETDTTIDEYSTATCCSGSDMEYTVSNVMNEYMSTHLGTLALAPLSTALGSLDLTSSTSTISTTSTAYKYGRGASNLGKMTKEIANTTRNTSRAISGIDPVSTGLSLAGSVVQGASELGNIAFTPNQINQTANINPNLDILKSAYVQYVVTDIEDCAKLYESLGYLIHEPYNSDDTTYWYNNSNWTIRYYYNVLNFDDINISLSSCPSDTTTEQLICERFKDGLRLWRTHFTGSGDFDTFLPLGTLWKYDNVEIANISS